MPGSSMLASARAIRFLPVVLIAALVGCGSSGSSTQSKKSTPQKTGSTPTATSAAKPKPAKNVPHSVQHVVVSYAKLRKTGRPVCDLLATRYLEKVSGKKGAAAKQACISRKQKPDASFAPAHLVITGYRRPTKTSAQVDAATARTTRRYFLVREPTGWKVLGVSSPKPR